MMVGRGERLFAGMALAMSTSALLPLLRGDGSGIDLTHDDPLLQAIWVGIYAIAAVLIFRYRMALGPVIAANKLLFALPGLVLLSALWSADPSVSLRRGVAFALSTLLAVYLAQRFSPAELWTILAWTLAGLVIASAAMAAVHPALGVDPLHHTWRGLFTTKNELGRIAALSGLIWLLRALTRRSVVTSAVLAGISFLVLVQSGSKTGMLVFLCMCALCLLLPGLRAHSSIAIPYGAVAGGAAFFAGMWVWSHSDAVVSSVGRDSTLTGRSDIWAAVWPFARDHPWLGWGYSAFWQGVHGPSADVWARLGFAVPHAHNGLLDLFLQLGAVGVVVFLAALAITIARAVRIVRQEWRLEHLMPLFLLGFTAFYNISESSLIERNSLFWLLLVVVAVQLGPKSFATVTEPAPALAPEAAA